MLYSHSSLESIELVNQIIPHIFQLPDDIDDDNPLVLTSKDDLAKLSEKNWSSITVNEDLFEDMISELSICDYPLVHFIYIQSHSFKNISHLTISNLPELRVLIIEDYSFINAQSLSLSSIFKLKKC